MRYIPRRLQQAGMTLVEVLLTMGLLSIFLVMLTTILTAALDAQTQSQSASTVIQDGRSILARMEYDVARASAVTSPSTLGASASTLGLTINSTATTYALNSGNLQITNANGTDNLNGGDTTVSGLSFLRLGNPGGKDTIRVTYTVTSKVQTRGGVNTQTFTSTLGDR